LKRKSGEYEGIGARRRVEIPLAVVGCDFRTASTSFREVLVTTPEERADLVASMRRMDASAGLVALETCNRVEWIVSSEEPRWMAELLKAQMVSRWCTPESGGDDLPEVYVHLGRDAAAHVFRLVAGMESLAAGEAEVAGQVQKALQRGIAEQTSCRILNGIGRFAGGIAKTSTRMGFRSGHSRGIHVLVGMFLEDRFGRLVENRRVVVAGMGEIGRKTADFIEQSVGCEVVRLNRTVHERHRRVWSGFDTLPEAVSGAVALVVASGARRPVVGPATLKIEGRSKPLLVMDIGIPRQVSPEVEGLSQVAYHDVDSLIRVGQEQRADDQFEQLEQEIQKQVSRFRGFCLERQIVSLLDRTQHKRFEMLGATLDKFVDERLGGQLDDQQRTRVVAAMKELVREYSHDVFEAVHAALEEHWDQE